MISTRICSVQKQKLAQITALFIIFSVNCCTSEITCNSLKNKKYHVNRQITKTGFHRTLVTRIQWEGETDGISSILLEETFPDGAYIDPFDAELQRRKIFGIKIMDPVDVEKPAYLSQPLKVLIYANVTNNTVLEIPIHFRYRLPKSFKKSGQYSPVNIQAPTLYIELAEEYDCDKETVVRKPCFHQGTMCNWIEIKYENDNSPLTVGIPHGNSDIAVLVAVVTLAVMFAGCFYAVFAVTCHGSKLKTN